MSIIVTRESHLFVLRVMRAGETVEIVKAFDAQMILDLRGTWPVGTIANWRILAERVFGIPEDVVAETWFNGASDHLYELQIDSAPASLRDRLTIFRDSALHFGHGFKAPKATKADVRKAIQEAKDLIRLIDEANGVPVLKGSWE